MPTPIDQNSLRLQSSLGGSLLYPSHQTINPGRFGNEPACSSLEHLPWSLRNRRQTQQLRHHKPGPHLVITELVSKQPTRFRLATAHLTGNYELVRGNKQTALCN